MNKENDPYLSAGFTPMRVDQVEEQLAEIYG